MSKKIVLSTAFLAAALQVMAQKKVLEKTYEFESKAKNRTLAHAAYNEDQHKYSFVYISGGKKDNYTIDALEFDDQFALTNKASEEMDLKAASDKYKLEKDDDGGSDAGVAVLTVENNFGSQIVIKKGLITRSYTTQTRYAGGGDMWKSTYATTKFNEIDKVKPRGMDGRKVSLVAFASDQPQVDVTTGTNYGFASTFQKKRKFSEASGDLLVVGMIQPDLFNKDDKEPTNKFFTIMSFSAQTLEMKKETKFNFEYPKVLVFQKQLPNGDLGLVFAAQHNANLPKKRDPDGLSYAYLRVGMDGTIKEKLDFKSLSSKWAVCGMSMQTNGDMYIYGPAVDNNESYYDKMIAKTNYEQFIVMKVSGGRKVYLTSTSKDDFEKMLKKSPAQKKADGYECKPFIEDAVTELANGEMLLKGQVNWNDGNGNKYFDLLLFHFSKDGKLRAQYASNKESNEGTATNANSPMYFLPSADGRSISWLIMEMHDMTTEGRPLRRARLGKIDVASATLTGMDDYGADDSYADNFYPFIVANKTVHLITSDKHTKTLSMTKVGLD